MGWPGVELLTASAPLLWGALAELLGERAGVLNIGIEGVMLVACLAAAVSAPLIGPWWAVAVAVVAAAAANSLFAIAVVLGADQVVAGTGMVLIGAGATGTVLRHLQARGFEGALVPTLPFGPLELGGLAAAGGIALFLARTRAGLIVRACGESPEAVAAAGVDPLRVRLVVLVVAGALIGVAGAGLVLRAAGAFVEGMTAGRGFLALALVLLGRWRAGWIVLATLFVGGASAIQFALQAGGLGGVPYHFLLALPYALTLIVLALVPPDRHGGPAALGRAYRRQR